MAARYACPQKQYILDGEGLLLAQRIARVGFEACIDRQRLAQAWNSMSSSAVYQEWLLKARSAGYAASFTLDESGERSARFSGKASVKAKNDPVSYDSSFKAPQGIAATSKQVNTLFGAACRFIAKVIVESLKDEFTWDNNLTPEEAAERYTRACMAVPVRSGVTLDVKEMDSKQNAFTHQINLEFDKLLCVKQDFAELYYSIYHNTPLVGKYSSSQQEWIKLSGAPWTLKGNTILEFLIQNYIVTGEGPQAVYMKGDDLDRRQANLKVDVDRKTMVSLYCGFQMEAIFSDTAEFCGYVYSNGVLCPSIRRKLNKVLGQGFKTEKHFYEYATSLRDWCLKLRSDMAYDDIIRVNAEQSGCPRSAVEDWFDVLESLCHVSYEDARQHMMERKEDIYYLSMKNNLRNVF